MHSTSRLRAALTLCSLILAAGVIGCDVDPGGTTYYNVTWTVSGSGTVNSYGSKTVKYVANKTCKLTALPQTGWHFVEWTGDVTGTDNPLSFTVTDDVVVQAVFEKDGGGGGDTGPTVTDLTITTSESTAVDFNLVSSASDATYSFPTLPAAATGTLQLISGSQYRFSPTLNFTGGDQFTYTAQSNSETSDPAEVNVIVAPLGKVGWARTFGSRTGTVVNAVAVSAYGDIYLAGHFKGTVDFDPGPASVIKTASGTSTDMFIAKFQDNGTFVWVKTFGGAGDDAATCVAVSSLNKIAVGGYFSQSVTFKGSTTTAQAATDAFVLELEYDGSVTWANVLPGTGDELVNGLAFSTTGELYVVGQFSTLITLEAGKTLSTAGGRDAFIIKYSAADGSSLWSYIFGGTGNDAATAVNIDDNNKILVAGYYSGLVDFDLQATADLKTSAGGSLPDAFVMKLAFDASLDWAASIGGTGEDAATCITTTTAGNIIVGGVFSGVADFNPQAAAQNATSNGGKDGFILALTGLGGYTWVKTFGGAGEDAVLGVSLDPSSNVYVTGYFAQIVNFSSTKQVTASGSIDAFVAKFFSSGGFSWVNAFGGTGDDAGRGIAISEVYHAIAAGSYENSVNLRPGTAATQTSIAFGGSNAFVELVQTNDGDW